MARVFPLVLVCLAFSACGPADAPARVELRARLGQDAGLSDAELGRLRDEVTRTIAGRAISVNRDGVVHPLDEAQRVVVLGMLSEPVGMFDEGVREEGGARFRVLNAPGHSSSSEIEASRRLWIEVETLLPRRFQFNYAFPNPEDYSLELIVN